MAVLFFSELCLCLMPFTLPWPCPVILISPKTDLQGQVDTHQSLLHDLRRENFVTQGAFTAALLCKADKGMVKSQRWKLDLVSKLLVSAGILEDGADGSGLCVREQKESKSCVVQQVASENDNTAYLEECLAHVEEDIARIEKVARSATVEAQRAVATAAEASARSEKATTQCLHVDKKCRQVDEKCQQADEKCQQMEKQCCDRLDESLEETGERIETNSTRIFHLAIEVEGLAKSIQERKAAATPLAFAREETGEVFSVELADLPSKKQRPRETTTATAAVPPKQQQATEKRRSEEKRQKRPSFMRRKTKDESEEMHEELCMSRRGEDQNHRAPCRPGVLGEPSPEGRTHTEASNIRTPFLAASLKQAAPPPRHRHSTYIGRRAVMLSGRKESAASRLVIGPVRPQEDRLAANQATPCSWARASSWPLLASEAPAAVSRQLHDLKADGEQATSTDDADVGAEENSLVRRDHATPNLELALAQGGPRRRETTKLKSEGEAPPDGGAVPPNGPSSLASDPGGDGMISCSPLHRRTTATGDHTDELWPEPHHDGEQNIAQSAHQSGDLSIQHQGTSNTEQPRSSPSQLLERMTAKEAAEALRGASAPRRRDNSSEEFDGALSTTVVTRRSSCDLIGTEFDSLSVRVESPGTRLACLGDTPELWCPRDTWDDAGAPESSSSDGSSTAIAVAGGREEDPPKAEPPMTGRDE